MKKALAAALAVTTLAVAAPALADDHRRWDRYERDHDYRGGYRWDDRSSWQADRLDQRIDRGVERGQITRREAARLYGELNYVAGLERRYARDGLSRWERQELQDRYARLRDQVRWERRDRERYGYRY